MITEGTWIIHWTDHILDHKASLNKFQTIEVMCSKERDGKEACKLKKLKFKKNDQD